MNLPLVWLVPAAAGALIGYVTNLVAVKMLFRPLKEVRFLGIRLPFTPGILPRQRHKLADNIGAMVERELLTPEILRARLRREEVRRSIRDSVARYTEKIRAAPLGQFFPAAGEGDGPGIPFIRFLIRSFAGSPVLGSTLREILITLAGHAGNYSVRDILGREASAALEKHLETIMEGQIRRSAFRISAQVLLLVKTAFPSAAAAFIHFLKKKEIHDLLEVHGQVFLSNTILRLNVLQRFFISAGQYDKTLNERMPEIIDDLIRQLDTLLTDPEVRRRIITFMDERVQDRLSGKDGPKQIARFFTGLAAANMDRPLGEFLHSFVRGEPSGLGPLLGEHISEWIQKDGAPKLEEALILGVEGFLEKHRDSSLGDLLSIDDVKKEALDILLCNKLLSLVDEQSAAALEAINIRALVRERIDSLDMIVVERIILDVMAHQLQWINVFGAILGAWIGIFQAAFSYFLR
jgi:hypothetical protein